MDIVRRTKNDYEYIDISSSDEAICKDIQGKDYGITTVIYRKMEQFVDEDINNNEPYTKHTTTILNGIDSMSRISTLGNIAPNKYDTICTNTPRGYKNVLNAKTDHHSIKPHKRWISWNNHLRMKITI